MDQNKPVALVRRTSQFERVQRRFRILATVAFAAIACAVALLAFRSRAAALLPVHRLDPSLIVQVASVERIFAIRPDSLSTHLWFATAQGLYEYDTVETSWRRWGCESGLPSQVVYDVCFRAGEVWAATKKGLSVRRHGAEQFILADSGAATEVQVLCSVGDSLVVAFVPGTGIVVYGQEGEPRQLEVAGLAPSHAVTCLRYLNGEVIIGTEIEELFAWNPSTGAQRRYRFDVRGNFNAQVLDVTSSGGRLWVATSRDGMWVSVGADSLCMVPEFPAKGAFVLQPESDGLWAGTPWGLFRYHTHEDAWIQFVHPKKRKPGDFQIMALHADAGRLWYGTADAGCGWFDKHRCSWRSMRAGLSQPNVAAIACSDSAVYVGFGYRGGYVDKLTLSTMQYEGTLDYNQGVGDPNIQSLALAGSRVVFGGFSGFGYTDPKSITWRYFIRGKPLQGYDITEMICTDSLYILGTVFGVVRYRPRDDSFAPYEWTTTDRVTCMYRAGDSLWYGTLSRGLKLLDMKTGVVQASYLTSMSRIVGIAPVGRSLFVATDVGGCFELDPTTGLTSRIEVDPAIFGEEPLAARNELRCMTVSDSLIWLGTEDAGCFVYDPSQRRWGSFTYYEGLVTDQVRAFCDTPRYLFIGCYGGLHRIDKQSPRFEGSIFGVRPVS